MYGYSFFEPPPPTRYDLNFTIARIPIRVHPLFWLMGLLFGLSSGGIIQLVVWVAVVFVSILIHELGHALAFRLNGLGSQIVLHIAGGLTVPEPVLWGKSWVQVSLTPQQEALVSLAGPLAGFLFAALATMASIAVGGTVVLTRLFGIILWFDVFIPDNPILDLIVGTIIWVNLFWGFINLLPVYPLDGGNVARNIMTTLDPSSGLRKSLQVSMITGIVMAVVGLILFRSTYITLLYGLLAYQSYIALRGYGNIF
jgi:Zn-dependent protease